MKTSTEPKVYLIQKFAELDPAGMVKIMSRAAGLLDLRQQAEIIAATLLLLAERETEM